MSAFGIPWDKVSWFPGHMAKGLLQIKNTLKSIHLVLEVRDARIPFSSGNPVLEEVIGEKRRLIVLNKTDLAHPNMTKRAVSILEGQGHRVVLTNAADGKHVQRIVHHAADLVKTRFQTTGIWMMVCGVPNVGKSSIINALRRHAGTLPKKEAAKVGPLPGVTRSVSGFKVSTAPVMFVVDTPGVMVPDVVEAEVGLKLALTGAVKDSVVGEEVLAQYLLHILNARKAYTYTSLFGLHEPTDDLFQLTNAVTAKIGGRSRGEDDPTFESTDQARERACRYLLKLYRDGALGTLCLDDLNVVTDNLKT
eukprot:GILK01011510.1.p1 GENE.GILK01011510.1~~GILK01011510.1.p1  ORF type:complete len:317 (+),score=37.86 GILK01011510.1:33-953(+)